MLLSKNNLTESVKATIIKAFDKIKTVEAVKAVYEVLSSQPKITTNKKPIAESLGFKMIGAKPIQEAATIKTKFNPEAEIFMKRAGIK